jgi:hypothetical protein
VVLQVPSNWLNQRAPACEDSDQRQPTIRLGFFSKEVQRLHSLLEFQAFRCCSCSVARQEISAQSTIAHTNPHLADESRSHRGCRTRFAEVQQELPAPKNERRAAELPGSRSICNFELEISRTGSYAAYHSPNLFSQCRTGSSRQNIRSSALRHRCILDVEGDNDALPGNHTAAEPHINRSFYSKLIQVSTRFMYRV